MTISRDAVEVLHVDLGERIGACFTQRLGGVSSGPWGGPEGIMGLNVGAYVGDNAACVRMNRSIVAQLVPNEPRWLHQVHGVAVPDAETVAMEAEADASTSLTPGVVCVVQVADCLPVLLASADGRGVAAIHAGWKGLAAGVIEAGVKRLRARLGDEKASLRAWLGPRIGYEDFECGEEVARLYAERYSDAEGVQKPMEDGTWRVDLAGYGCYALERLGVTDIQDCGFSTVADANRWFSFRRDGAQSGRHAALIWIK